MFKTESEMKRSYCPVRAGQCVATVCQACIPHHARETETGQRVPLARRYSSDRPVTVFFYCGQYGKPCEAEYEIPPLEI